MGEETLSCADFVAFIQSLDPLLPAKVLFYLLADPMGGLDAFSLSSVQAVNAAAKWRRLAKCRSFIEAGFGAVDSAAFRALFEGNAPVEEGPYIQFQGEVKAYRGREWLQRLFNTLDDERGRKLLADPLHQTGGVWLYMFPLLQGQTALTDFKDLPEAQAVTAKLARWHHAHGFVDLRRLKNGERPELEWRAFLTQTAPQPTELSEHGTAYRACESYVKGRISLDRPLRQLCPRSPEVPVQVGGESYIPPPPPKRPPPTVTR